MDVAPHRGFNLKAREVLLEPLPPFAVSTKERENHEASSVCTNNNITVAPHRGFSAKAKELLIERDFTLPFLQRSDSINAKSRNDTDRQKQMTQSAREMNSSASNSSLNLISVSTLPGRGFDEAPEFSHSKASRIKARVLLGDIGKTRSAIDLYQKQRKDRPSFKGTFLDESNKRRSVTDINKLSKI